MIRNEAEYQEASKRLFEELGRLGEHRDRLKEAGLGEIEIQRVIDPLESFHLQLKEEAEVGILTFNATADGTCFGQKVGPVWGSSVYVKHGDAWKWTFGINVPARS
jgi:hypothetical protein